MTTKGSIQLMTIVIGLTVITLLTSCGKAAESSSSSSTTSSTIAGTINFANISRLSTLSGRTFSANNYFIWLQNRATKKVYFVEIGSDGKFELDVAYQKDVTNGESFFAAIIQKEPLTYIGPITLGTNSTGLTLKGDSKDITIAFDGNLLKGNVSNSPSNIQTNTDYVTRVNAGTGIPVGAGNAGKSHASEATSLKSNNTIDQDEDGVPDIFDAMNNGAKIDNAISGSGSDISAHSERMSQAVMFMNLKVDKANESTFTVTEDGKVVIELKSRNASLVSSAKAYLLHTNYKTAKMDAFPNGFTQVDAYPAENSLWSATSYKLFKATNLSSETIWTAFFKPNNNAFKPGDLILVQVDYTDGTKDYFWLSLNFKFKTIVHDTTSYTSGSGTQVSPYVMGTTGDKTFTFDAPTDETGAALSGLEYSFEVFYYNSSNQSIGSRQVVTVGTDTLSGVLPASIIDLYPSAAYIQVDVTSRYPYGDNSASKIYIKRSSW